jgi:diaminohydroxyphosphoribosylaminopyrimidine deaminase / 5-amino-6-(5-phosphoribosylamino)uracil reductase
MRSSEDIAYLEMAYGLAEKARGRTSPNPCVGSVIVKDGRVVGTGYHREAGQPHAEIIALAEAGARTRGATIYITLEPCVHWGRTPPCAASLARAGLRRAVVSDVDPNPLVDSRGIRALRKAGIEVSLGLLREKNLRLNESYLKYISRKIPFVTLKAAVSLDGRIAARDGRPGWISSKDSRDYVHLLRGENDATLAGIGTILRDDPRLTVRHPLWKGKTIVRVILDSRLRTPPGAAIFGGRGGILIFCGKRAPADRARLLEARGATIIPIPSSAAGLDPGRVLEELGKREIASLVVEGGSRVFSSFIDSGLADKILLFAAPKLIGGRAAPSILEGEGAASIGDALRLRDMRCLPVGEDRMIEGYF